jgi:hypothetical protein
VFAATTLSGSDGFRLNGFNLIAEPWASRELPCGLFPILATLCVPPPPHVLRLWRTLLRTRNSIFSAQNELIVSSIYAELAKPVQNFHAKQHHGIFRTDSGFNIV